MDSICTFPDEEGHWLKDSFLYVDHTTWEYVYVEELSYLSKSDIWEFTMFWCKQFLRYLHREGVKWNIYWKDYLNGHIVYDHGDD